MDINLFLIVSIVLSAIVLIVIGILFGIYVKKYLHQREVDKRISVLLRDIQMKCLEIREKKEDNENIQIQSSRH